MFVKIYSIQKDEYSKERKDFIPRVYFLRRVRESENTSGSGFIHVLNEEIKLPADYINFFVVAEWDLCKESLTVSIEREKVLQKIIEIDFKINKHTKQKLIKGGAHSFCI